MKLNKSQEDRARALHETYLVFDMHSDIQCELIRRRSISLFRMLVALQKTPALHRNSFLEPTQSKGIIFLIHFSRNQIRNPLAGHG